MNLLTFIYTISQCAEEYNAYNKNLQWNQFEVATF